MTDFYNYKVTVTFHIGDYSNLSKLCTVLADMIIEGDGHNVRASIDPHPRGPCAMAMEDLEDAIDQVNRLYAPPEMDAWLDGLNNAIAQLSNIRTRVAEDVAIVNRKCSDPREDASPETCNGCVNLRPSPDGNGTMCNLSKMNLLEVLKC